MGEDIGIVYADILKTSAVFADGGKRYANIVPKNIGAVPKVAEGSLEHAISSVLNALEVMHDTLGSSMQTHGEKLKYVHDNYRGKEQDVNDLLNRIENPEGVQPRF